MVKKSLLLGIAIGLGIAAGLAPRVAFANDGAGLADSGRAYLSAFAGIANTADRVCRAREPEDMAARETCAVGRVLAGLALAGLGDGQPPAVKREVRRCTRGAVLAQGLADPVFVLRCAGLGGAGYGAVAMAGGPKRVPVDRTVPEDFVDQAYARCKRETRCVDDELRAAQWLIAFRRAHASPAAALIRRQCVDRSGGLVAAERCVRRDWRAWSRLVD